jgi:hypothetical protein
MLCEQVFRGRGLVGGRAEGSPSPSHYSVGIHGCLLVGGGCYSYIRFEDLKKNTVLTKFNTVLTKKNTVLAMVNRVLTKVNSTEY